jgi:hypothetical protein
MLQGTDGKDEILALEKLVRHLVGFVLVEGWLVQFRARL